MCYFQTNNNFIIYLNIYKKKITGDIYLTNKRNPLNKVFKKDIKDFFNNVFFTNMRKFDCETNSDS